MLTTCGVTQAIKQADCLIACVTPQIENIQRFAVRFCFNNYSWTNIVLLQC